MVIARICSFMTEESVARPPGAETMVERMSSLVVIERSATRLLSALVPTTSSILVKAPAGTAPAGQDSSFRFSGPSLAP